MSDEYGKYGHSHNCHCTDCRIRAAADQITGGMSGSTAKSTTTGRGKEYKKQGHHRLCDCSDCREFRAGRLGGEQAAASSEECDRQDGGSIPVDSTPRAHDCIVFDTAIGMRTPPPTLEDAVAAAPKTAASAQQLIPPYDRRYEDGPALTPTAAARRRIEELAADWGTTLQPALSRVIAIGLSAIDVLECRNTAFTREQVANQQKALDVLKAAEERYHRNQTIIRFGEEATRTLGSTPVGNPPGSFYRPAGAPVSPADKPQVRMCYSGCGTEITPANEVYRFDDFSFCNQCAPAAREEYAKYVDARDKAAGIQQHDDPNPTMFVLHADKPQQTANCPANPGGVCSEFCRPTEGKTGFHSTGFTHPNTEKSKAFLRSFEFVQSPEVPRQSLSWPPPGGDPYTPRRSAEPSRFLFGCDDDCTCCEESTLGELSAPILLIAGALGLGYIAAGAIRRLFGARG